MRKYRGSLCTSGTGSTTPECSETTTTNTTTTTTTIPEYTLATYKYDTLGRRYEKKVYTYNQTNQTTDLTKNISYIYSNQDAIQETDAVSSTTKEYVYGSEVDDLVASIQNGATTYYEKNHLGSIVNVSDASGATLTEYVYDVYGTATITSGADTGNVRLYTGREFDEETNFYYNRARYYSPTLGRFISRDPIGIKDNVNLYLYVGNNPLIYTDKMGLEKAILSIYADRGDGSWKSGHSWIELEYNGEKHSYGFFPIVGIRTDHEIPLKGKHYKDYIYESIDISKEQYEVLLKNIEKDKEDYNKGYLSSTLNWAYSGFCAGWTSSKWNSVVESPYKLDSNWFPNKLANQIELNMDNFNN